MIQPRIRAAAIAAMLLVVAGIGVTACQPGIDCNGAVYYPGADLSGSDQSGKDLYGCELVGIDFSGANFTGTYLRNADLTGSDVSGATFAGADLGNAKLIDAEVEGAELASAVSFLVQSGDVTGTPASLPADWSLRGGYFIGPYANFVGKVLSGIDLSHTNLTGAFLTGADLTGADLRYASMAGTHLDATALDGALLDRVTSGGIFGVPASLPDGWTLVDGTLVGPTGDQGSSEEACAGGEGCSVPPVDTGDVTTTASFGPGESSVTLVVSVSPDDAPAFSCEGFPPTPDRPIVEFYFTGGDASDRAGTLDVTYRNLGAEPDLDEFWKVCWAAPYPFIADTGTTLGLATIQGTKPGTADPLYVGLLPPCQLTDTIAVSPPCVHDVQGDGEGSVTVTISTTGADPWRY